MGERVSGVRGNPQPVSERVVRKVSAEAGTEPAELEPSLYETVDPDTLDAVFDGDEGVRVTFECAGYRVVVDPGDTVEVRNPDRSDGDGRVQGGNDRQERP